MTTLIALLRGINIGGHHKLPMQALTALLTEIGLREVRTHLQSGNVVFRSNTKDRAALAAKISAAIAAQYGFAPQVLLLDAAELREAMAKNPYPEAEAAPSTLSLLFLAASPFHPDLQALEAIRASSERFKLVGNVFYMHAPEGFGRSRLAASAERLLGVAASGRNWNTVCKLAEMVG